MLPEKLSFAFSFLAVIAVSYLAHIHKWQLEQYVLTALLAVLVMTIVGRVVGVICSRELAKSTADHAKRSQAAAAPADSAKTA